MLLVPVDRKISIFDGKIGVFSDEYGTFLCKNIEDMPVVFDGGKISTSVDGEEVELTPQKVEELIFEDEFKGKKGMLIKRVEKPIGDKDHYFLVRAPPSEYENTDQQVRIKEAGDQIRKKCTGKKGDEFKKCRHKVLDTIFKKNKGDEE